MSLSDRPHHGVHVHVPYDSIDQYLDFIREEQLNLEIYFGSRSFDGVTIADILLLREKLDYKPELSIHAPFMDLSPGAVDAQVRTVTEKRFNDVFDFAEILRPKAIVFHSGFERWKYAHEVNIWLDGSLKTWQPLNQRAENMGVRIAVENIFEDDPSNLVILAEAMNSDNFGLCFDAGHFNLFSQLPLTEWLGKIKPHVKEIHLHDNNRYADQHLAIGDGDFDFATLFSELKNIDCIYTVEAHTIENVQKSLAGLKSYL